MMYIVLVTKFYYQFKYVSKFTTHNFRYSYSNESCKLERTIEVHTKVCRCVEFDESGDLLFSVSKDKSIVVSDMTSGKMKRFTEDAHE
jgi:WD repeat-containing protein 55